MANETYKFPDEIEEKKPEVEFQVEIIDDTPPQDKGREKMPQKIVDELEKDDLEEYSDKVKTRLAQMKKVCTTSAARKKPLRVSGKKLFA